VCPEQLGRAAAADVKVDSSPVEVCHRVVLRQFNVVLMALGLLMVQGCVLDLSILTAGAGGAGAGGNSGTSSGGGGSSSSNNPTAVTSATGGGGGAGGTSCAPGAECGFCENTCTAESCEPKTLVANASGNSYASPSLWIEGDTLYWLDFYNQHIMRMLPSGETETVTPKGLLNSAITFVVHGDKLYWSDFTSGINSCPLDNCTVDLKKRMVANDNNQAEALQLLADDTHLYWYTGPDHYARPVRRCPLSAADATPEPIATNQDLIRGIALTDKHVYWTARPNNQGGLVRRTTKDGGSQVTDYTTKLEMAWALTLDSTHLYLTSGADESGALKRCSLGESTCGSLDDVLSGLGALKRTRSVALGGGRVYVTNESSGTVIGRAKDGTGTEEIVADAQTRPHSMLATKHCVYWRDDNDNGTVWTRRHQPPAP
jgi:hypothetical protein